MNTVGESPFIGLSFETAASLPSNFNQTVRNSTDVTFTWSGDADQYFVQLSNQAGSYYQNPPVSINSLQPSTTYPVYITGYSANESISGSTATFSVSTAEGPPQAPSNLILLSHGSNSARLQWDAAPDVPAYVLRAEWIDGGVTKTHIQDLTATIDELPPNNVIVASVGSTTTGGTTYDTSNVTFVTLPESPSNPAVSDITPNGFTITWDDDHAFFYEVSAKPHETKTVFEKSYTFTQLIPNTTYNVRIKPYNFAIEPGTSLHYTVTTASGTPLSTPAPVILPSITSFTVSWEPIPGAVYYLVYVDGTPHIII